MALLIRSFGSNLALVTPLNQNGNGELPAYIFQFTYEKCEFVCATENAEDINKQREKKLIK